ncbi:hypothetical protein PR202_ga04503 [Eleusine coracana subsp. coracana]|uniref:Argonaute linker 1 domain-containing protein n=1 Tax=Eleusine coracana subsp. coracana TaxID=191504 RepID=A0AAV5BS78_ELECO|nr:hypothetical protein PR202_ga04503 [Eleusine coracana subsp. coracana]
MEVRMRRRCGGAEAEARGGAAEAQRRHCEGGVAGQRAAEAEARCGSAEAETLGQRCRGAEVALQRCRARGQGQGFSKKENKQGLSLARPPVHELIAVGSLLLSSSAVLLLHSSCEPSSLPSSRKDDQNKSLVAGSPPISRPLKSGTKGQKVDVKYEDGHPAELKGVMSRKVIDKLQEIYFSDLGNMSFAYDGERNLFTIGSLPHVRDVFTVIVEVDGASSAKTVTSRNHGGDGGPGGSDIKRMKRPVQIITFKVELSFARKVPISAITKVLSGRESDNYQDVLGILDIILRQNSAKQGCLLVRQSFFYNSNFDSIGGDVLACRGYHSSFQPTQTGLSLNVDTSTTMIVKPGPVIDFLLSNQGIKDINRIDWRKPNRRSTWPISPTYKSLTLHSPNPNCHCLPSSPATRPPRQPPAPGDWAVVHPPPPRPPPLPLLALPERDRRSFGQEPKSWSRRAAPASCRPCPSLTGDPSARSPGARAPSCPYPARLRPCPARLEHGVREELPVTIPQEVDASARALDASAAALSNLIAAADHPALPLLHSLKSELVTTSSEDGAARVKEKRQRCCWWCFSLIIIIPLAAETISVPSDEAGSSATAAAAGSGGGIGIGSGSGSGSDTRIPLEGQGFVPAAAADEIVDVIDVDQDDTPAGKRAKKCTSDVWNFFTKKDEIVEINDSKKVPSLMTDLELIEAIVAAMNLEAQNKKIVILESEDVTASQSDPAAMDDYGDLYVDL